MKSPYIVDRSYSCSLSFVYFLRCCLYRRWPLVYIKNTHMSQWISTAFIIKNVDMWQGWDSNPCGQIFTPIGIYHFWHCGQRLNHSATLSVLSNPQKMARIRQKDVCRLHKSQCVFSFMLLPHLWWVRRFLWKKNNDIPRLSNIIIIRCVCFEHTFLG